MCAAASLLSACRVCLASDREMFRLANTALEETYERVTSGTLVVEGWPCCVCGVCLSALRRCRRFIDTAREANDALDRWIRDQPNTDTLKLPEYPLFSFTRSPMELIDMTCQEDNSEVKEESDMFENSKMMSPENQDTYDDEGNILTEEIKYEVTGDDGNDYNQVSDDESDNTHDLSDNIESHSSPVLSNTECVNIQEEPIDVEMDAKPPKLDISNILDNVRGDNAPGISNIRLLRSRKRVKLNHDTEKNSKMMSPENQNTYDDIGNILTEEIKYEVTGDDGNDYNQVSDDESNNTHDLSDNIESHSSPVLSNTECVNIQEEPIDVEMDAKPPKLDISNILDNVGGDNAPGISNIRLLRSRKMVKLNHDTEKNSKMMSPENQDTYDDVGNILTEEIKYEVTGDDGNDHNQVSDDESDNTHDLSDNIESHSSPVLSNTECVNIQEEPIDVEMDAKPPKHDISNILDNVGGDNAPGISNIRLLRSRKRVKLNHDTESGPALKKRRPITSRRRRGDTDPPATLRKDVVFSCDQCNYKSPSKTKLNAHLKTHTDEKPFTCDKCGYRCKKKNGLNLHLRIHSSDKPFACDKCDFKCNSNTNLKQHLRKHTDEKPFSCEKCDYRSDRKKNLQIHSMVHTGEKPFACQLCDYRGTHAGSLKEHLRTHTGEKPFACDKCDYKSSWKKSLKLHLMNHEEDRRLACDICDFKTIYKNNLKVHMRTHSGEKPFACDKCDCKYGHKTDLKKHLLRHTNEKPFSCDYKCNHKLKIQQHLLSHGDMAYLCDNCDYKCKRKYELKKHYMTHTGINSYEICDYRTYSISKLKIHMRTHTGEKPFACDNCDFRCNQKPSLKRHLRTHTGEKPFACDKCDYKCSYKHVLDKHLKGVHAVITPGLR